MAFSSDLFLIIWLFDVERSGGKSESFNEKDTTSLNERTMLSATADFKDW